MKPWNYRTPNGPPPAQIVAQRFAHPNREEPVEMERREMRRRGQGVEIERPVQLPVDDLDDAVHSARIYRAAIARRHAAPNK